MVTRDAETFVALGRAMSLATAEGALEAAAARDLAAALVAAILTGSMDLDTYAQIHEALARLLELTFAGGVAEETSTGPSSRSPTTEGEDSLGGYLEIVGEAWDKVSRQEEGNGRVRGFIRNSFDLTRAHFGGECWFEAPLLIPPEEMVQRARAAGLLIVAIEPASPGTELTARLCPPDAAHEANCGRVILGWGDRRADLSFSSAA